jgi:hypothetical protein
MPIKNLGGNLFDAKIVSKKQTCDPTMTICGSSKRPNSPPPPPAKEPVPWSVAKMS